MNISIGQLLIKKGRKVKPLKVFAGMYEQIPKDWQVFGFSLDGTINYVVTEGEISGGAVVPESVMQQINKYLPKIKFT